MKFSITIILFVLFSMASKCFSQVKENIHTDGYYHHISDWKPRRVNYLVFFKNSKSISENVDIPNCIEMSDTLELYKYMDSVLFELDTVLFIQKGIYIDNESNFKITYEGETTNEKFIYEQFGTIERNALKFLYYTWNERKYDSWLNYKFRSLNFKNL